MLEQGLDARDEDACSAVPPGGEGRDPGGGLVGDELAALVGQRRPRIQHSDLPRIAEPCLQLLGHAVADLRVSRDPDDALIDSECRSEVRLGAVWHGHDAGVAADPADIAGRAEPLPDGPNEPVSARSGGSTDRSGSR